MARHDTADRRARRERDRDAGATHPTPELRWVQLREPRHALEIGANGRFVGGRFREGDDAWHVLLETYEGELAD